MISSHAPSASRSPLLRPDDLAGGRGRGYVTNGRSATRIALHPAEREGFEPSVPSRVHLISNQAPSATRTSLRGGLCLPGWGLSTREGALFDRNAGRFGGD